jgi:hypothetical protein
VPAESYRAKADIAEERRGLELQLAEVTEGDDFASSLVEYRVRSAQSARLAYMNGDASTRHEVVSALLWNPTLKDGNVAYLSIPVTREDAASDAMNSWRIWS